MAGSPQQPPHKTSPRLRARLPVPGSRTGHPDWRRQSPREPGPTGVAVLSGTLREPRASASQGEAPPRSLSPQQGADPRQPRATPRCCQAGAQSTASWPRWPHSPTKQRGSLGNVLNATSEKVVRRRGAQAYPSSPPARGLPRIGAPSAGDLGRACPGGSASGQGRHGACAISSTCTHGRGPRTVGGAVQTALHTAPGTRPLAPGTWATTAKSSQDAGQLRKEGPLRTTGPAPHPRHTRVHTHPHHTHSHTPLTL